MARGARPKIDPALDLAPYLKTVEGLQGVFDPCAQLGRVAPVEIEIGSGKGLFLTRIARTCPDRLFVGVEIAKSYAALIAGRLAKAQATNALIFQGDGVRFADEHIAPNSVDAFHVYFPDPWWKKKHRKRRVLNERLLRAIERNLKPGGRLHFWTDVQEYFETTLELIAEVTRLEGPLEVAESSPEHDLDYRTHFERRSRLSGLPVYRSEFICRELSEPATPPPVE
ncbi:MAG: tRNA (guanosine(46)-N7)-methyltransferase TrmB [Planctomycetales bacterium]|nr:tRNA (guanosine(46)-N7)-methyltransferase TrmB [Planctomycetales bacterium]